MKTKKRLPMEKGLAKRRRFSMAALLVLGALLVSVPAAAQAPTTVTSNSAEVNTCNQLTVTGVFSGDDNGNGGMLVEYNTADAWPGTTACAAVTGPSPRMCLVTGLPPTGTYFARVTYTDPDGVVGANPQVLGPFTLPICGADRTAPTITVLAPARNAVLVGADVVKAQVYDAGGLKAINPVEWSLDGGGFTALGVALNANYSCGSGCGLYEISLPAQPAGPHYLTIRATDAAPLPNMAQISWPFRSNTTGTGSGLLLRRTHGSQLCTDCHALKSHSSQSTSGTYGNWALDCLTCHTPHKTTNIYLVRNTIATPNSGNATIVFHKDDKASGGNPQSSYLGAFDGGGAPYSDGICEACHTKTNHYRNDASGGDHTHNQGTRCVLCHTHSQGFAGLGCEGCHGKPPAPAEGDSHAAHVLSTTAVSSYSNAALESTATEYGFPCAKCHNGTHSNSGDAPKRVEIAGESTAPNTTAMSYAQVYPGAFTDTGPTGTQFSWDKGACSNVYCHGAFSGGTAANSYTWGTSTTACGDCHGVTATPPAGGVHSTHLGRGHGDTNIYLKCDDCHQGIVDATPALLDKGLHVNGGANWNLRTENPRIGAGATYSGSEAGVKTPPSTTYGACTNVYCHSNGDPVNGASAPISFFDTIRWNRANATCLQCHRGMGSGPGCEACHGFDTAATFLIGENTVRKGSTGHVKHVRTYGFKCHDCHSVTMLNRNKNRNNLDPSKTTHVNVAKDVNFSAWPTDETGGTWSGATHQCTSTYCHSMGTTTTPPFGGATSIAWTDTADPECDSCHGGNAASVATGGSQGPLATNSHGKHISTPWVFSCTSCHSTVVSADRTISSTALHVNAVKNVSMGTGAWNSPGASQCSGTSSGCHGAGTPTWGGTAGCLDCHGAATDSANWNISDGAMSTIDAAQWSYSGHGRPAASGNYDVTNNPPADFGAGGANPCLYCHDDTVSHKEGTNPFRLRSGATTNQVCLNCHATGGAGVQPAVSYALLNATRKIGAYHFDAKHGAGNNGGQFCWDCHEPHGDRKAGSGNIAMIGSEVTKQSDGLYGIPAARVATVFTSHSSASDFAKSTPGPYTGICNVCHVSTNHYTATAGDGHNSSDICTSCHRHDQPPAGAFKVNSWDCLACHLYAQGSRRSALIDFSRPHSHTPEYNSSDLTDPTKNNCLICHQERPTGGLHQNGAVDYNPDPDSSGTSEWNGVYYSWWCLDCHDSASPGVFGGQTAPDQTAFYNSTHVNTPSPGVPPYCGSCHLGDPQFAFSDSLYPYYGNTHGPTVANENYFSMNKITGEIVCTEEDACFVCHGGFTNVRRYNEPACPPGNKVYMENILTSMQGDGAAINFPIVSKHFSIDPSDGETSCRSCHDPHQIDRYNNRMVCDPDNPTQTWAGWTQGGGAPDSFCSRCHDGTQASPPVHSGIPLGAKKCVQCHTVHGSTNRRLQVLSEAEMAAITVAVAPPAPSAVAGSTVPFTATLAGVPGDRRIEPQWTVTTQSGGASPTEFTSADGPFALLDPPAFTPTGTTVSTITVPASFTIYDLNIFVNAAHSSTYDLSLVLEHVESNRRILLKCLGTSGAGYVPTWYDQEQSVPGSERGDGRLEEFCGDNAQGTWRLRMTDHYPADSGTLTSWTLSFNNGVVGAITADGTFLAVAPGTATVRASAHSGKIKLISYCGSWWNMTETEQVATTLVTVTAAAVKGPALGGAKPPLKFADGIRILPQGRKADAPISPPAAHAASGAAQATAAPGKGVKKCERCHLPADAPRKAKPAGLGSK